MSSLSGEIHKLEDQIKDVSSLKAEIESLKARQRSVEDCRPIAICRSTCSMSWSSPDA